MAAVLPCRSPSFPRELLGLVYGDSFRDAAEPLLLLLPGAVLFAGSAILAAGIYAAGRPFTATVAQVLGMVVTVVGLSVFLTAEDHRRGLGLDRLLHRVFVATLLLYKRVSGPPWRAFLPTPGRLRAMARTGSPRSIMSLLRQGQFRLPVAARAGAALGRRRAPRSLRRLGAGSSPAWSEERARRALRRPLLRNVVRPDHAPLRRGHRGLASA